MKIALLSRNPELYSTQRLMEAGAAAGHEMELIDYSRCYLVIDSGAPKVVYQGVVLDHVDAVIPRIGVSLTFYGAAVVRQFEMMGTYALNRSQGISRSRDKLRSLQLMARKGVGIPTSGIAHSTKDVAGLLEAVGNAPVVVKLLEGTQGIGVVLCETEKAATSVIEAFRGLNADILVQHFIAESKGADIRAFVVGDRVVAAMKRQGAPGEFRSNLHRGGSATRAKLSPDERTTAVDAARAMGLRVAGVDMLRSDRGPKVMEVNSSPGLEGIEKTTGVDVAGHVIRYIEKHAGGGHKVDRLEG